MKTRSKTCSRGCGRPPHKGARGIGPASICLGENLSALEIAHEAWTQAHSSPKGEERAVEIMRAIEPSLLVHALYLSETLCGRERPYREGRAWWPTSEVWVSLDGEDLLTCPGCVEALRLKKAAEAERLVLEEREGGPEILHPKISVLN